MVLASAVKGGKPVRFVERRKDEFLVSGADAGGALGHALFVSGAFKLEAAPARATRFKGRRVELVLSDRRFLFPVLAAPRKASDFLDAMVRSQIDRLTPWTRSQAEFGFVKAAGENDQTNVTLAVAARAALAPYVAAAEALGADSVAVFAARPSPEDAGPPILVRDGLANQAARLRRHKFVLAAALALCTAFAAAAAGLDAWFEVETASAQTRLANLVAEMRAHVGNAESDPALAAAMRRKREIAPAVVVLERLARALPDDAYLTQLHIGGAKLEIDGVARSASGLVATLDQAAPFQRVQFSAPTTPAAVEGREQFHIEAAIGSPAALRP